ncbi:FeoA family protein [Levilactobacillus zymae]|uniref:Iron transporter FeoA n=1 Tax=Levilactobacillus zymae TaxID=267363 RepID=A0A1Y6K2V8_9LACO|nr:FeoA family protein [Levilactobacillus zymae]KRL12686.1 hypothetical protein FD38_GL001422 [Levilactobacillus zymae DSM 19395]QFR61996.1 ferrous iron transport protein A [Levilactobacillus zymae]GEO72405.1 iron transporter FeoA [Levilactobacillus zymae]SMS15433.1 hypothetical protein LZ3411_2383 [Levilactobacillus zymae]
MQLLSDNAYRSQFTVRTMDQIDELTTRQLHNLGIQTGSLINVVRFYPFHGPVVIQVDQQRLALRYRIYRQLVGGH